MVWEVIIKRMHLLITVAKLECTADRDNDYDDGGMKYIKKEGRKWKEGE